MADFDGIFKALRLLPEFDGNPNILTRFIQLCDELVDEFTEPEASKIALLNGILNKVVGPAARLINSNGIPNNWTGIRNALINNFADQRDETALYNDLALLTQGPGTPQEFYERCQNIFSTVMTYVTLHETVATTIDAKRDLYKRLTLQAFLRGLKDPLGSRIRCMRPETIEKALEFVHEETNTLYMQHRNEHLPDKRSFSQPLNQFNQQFKMPNALPFASPKVNSFAYDMPGPSRPQFLSQGPSQWRPNFNQLHQAGPSRTQQLFRAPPPNYSQNNTFKLLPRNPQFQYNSPPQQPRPMSGVSHFVPRNLPPSSFATGHNWMKAGNPPPTNYFKSREMHFNDCYNFDPSFDEHYQDCYPGYESYDYPEYYFDHEQEQSPEDYPEYPQLMPSAPESGTQQENNQGCNDQDFQKVLKSSRSK